MRNSLKEIQNIYKHIEALKREHKNFLKELEENNQTGEGIKEKTIIFCW